MERQRQRERRLGGRARRVGAAPAGGGVVPAGRALPPRRRGGALRLALRRTLLPGAPAPPGRAPAPAARRAACARRARAVTAVYVCMYVSGQMEAQDCVRIVFYTCCLCC